jgi:hypothetical protein
LNGEGTQNHLGIQQFLDPQLALPQTLHFDEICLWEERRAGQSIGQLFLLTSTSLLEERTLEQLEAGSSFLELPWPEHILETYLALETLL